MMMTLDYNKQINQIHMEKEFNLKTDKNEQDQINGQSNDSKQQNLVDVYIREVNDVGSTNSTKSIEIDEAMRLIADGDPENSELQEIIEDQLVTWQQGQTKNIFKFIIKLIKKYIDSYGQRLYPQYGEDLESLKTLLNQIFDNYKLDGLNQGILKKLLSDQTTEDIGRRSRLARLIMSKILAKKRKLEVLNNKRIKNKKIYMTTLKVCQLRCLNSKTSSRLQTQSSTINELL